MRYIISVEIRRQGFWNKLFSEIFGSCWEKEVDFDGEEYLLIKQVLESITLES